MKPEVLGVHPLDRADPVNRRAIADEMISINMGVASGGDLPSPGNEQHRERNLLPLRLMTASPRSVR
jgi:hypothetical protein